MKLAILKVIENQRTVGMFATIIQIEVRLTAVLESVEQFQYFGNIDRFNNPVTIEDLRSDRSWYGQITNINYNQRENHVELELRMICEDPKQKEYKWLNEKYPHTCHKCGRGLFFQELLKANKNMTGEHLATLWKREEVEFYCCSCYRKVGRHTRIVEQIAPWYFAQEYEQNPHPTIPIISTPRQSYFWAYLSENIRPGDLLQRIEAPTPYELYGEIRANHELGILERIPRNDAVDAMAHAADLIIYDKTNKIRRFIKKCVKKVIFWKM